jgi:hypothetical protein
VRPGARKVRCADLLKEVNMIPELKGAKAVPFDSLLLDPNNPRIAPMGNPDYDNLDAIRNPQRQAELTDTVYEAYKAEGLEKAIKAQGWKPLDAMIVWQPPKAVGVNIVVEGNTRTAVLRRIRAELAELRAKQKRLERSARSFAPNEAENLQREIADLEEIVEQTAKVEVHFVDAKTADELLDVLPRLLGVRHIVHAKQWTPYAQNLFLASLYYRAFRARYPDPKVELKLEKDLLKEVGDIVSMTERDTRRAIQVAQAYSHFKLRYEEKLAKGDRGFQDEDQYFFKQILDNPYPRQQFGFEDNDLRLSDEMEETLFRWAFEKPRPKTGTNPNKFKRAEDMRLWQRMKKYDDDHHTGFAQRFNVQNPGSVPSIQSVDLAYRGHKSAVKPIENIQRLIESFGDLKGETLMTQGDHLEPMLEQVIEIAQRYLDMVRAGQRALAAD